MFGSADEILHVYWSVCVCVCQLECMSAWINEWINERMTEWLFFFRLKIKKNHKKRHWGDSNSQTLDHWAHTLQLRLLRMLYLKQGLLAIYLTWIGQRDRRLRWRELCGFESHPDLCFLFVGRCFKVLSTLDVKPFSYWWVFVCVCLHKEMKEWLNGFSSLD